FLIGRDPLQIERLWQEMFRGAFFPAGNILTSAIAAIDIALWDIKGKALGVPVYELLGGRVRDKVACYPHNDGSGSIEQLVESCVRSKDDGYEFLRWNLPYDGDVLEPAGAVRTVLRQMEAVRRAVGDEMEICFDIHARLDPPDAVRLLRALEPFRPFFVEDPIRCENPQSYRHLRAQTHVPLAAGEQYASKWEMRPLVEEELVDYVRADLCICGGLTETRKIAGWCETHHIRVATHNPLGPVSTAACLHFNLACTNVAVQEQRYPPGTIATDLCPVQVEASNGYLLPPSRPGLGVEIDRTVVARMRGQYRLFAPPQLRRLDGAFTNW
ncbi:MAG: mandelate racemase/muconate lactonizing enzyme family protein, partial [Chloroflexi bacterium]|nr:mandelate racemase/muconate lactonizing enzyme family protein [Chloroflexota bacterium]